jgi:hypothetical protein
MEICKNLLRDSIYPQGVGRWLCRHPSARGVARYSKFGAAKQQTLSTFRFLCSARLALEPLATIFIRFHGVTCHLIVVR